MIITKKETIVILSTFTAIAVIFSSIYLASQKPKEQDRAGEALPSIPKQAQEQTKTGVKIPEIVNSYNGIVAELGDGFLLLKAASHNNYLVQDKVLEIHFNGTTKVYKRILPKTIAPDVRFVEARETAVAKEDVKVGDRVEIYSQANIKDGLSFKTDIIKILEF
jgi:hypothetical protein